MEFNIRDVIDGQYKVLERYRGGMSLVYIVLDEFSQKRFAVKTVKTEDLADRGAVTRFGLEARTWMNLDRHENIVQAMIYREIEEQPFLFLEYVDGTDLHKLLDHERKLLVVQALDLALQVCAGMDYVHNKDVGTGDRGVVHRDLKPGNTMLTRHKVAKVTDFGLAKVHGVRTRLTATGVGMGTYLYMPPEQFLDASSADKTTDIYAFGVMLYQMLTGQMPMGGKNVGNLIHNIMNKDPAPPSRVAPEVPETLDHIVLKCLAKKREDRYPSFGHIAFELNVIHTEQLGQLGRSEHVVRCVQCGYLTAAEMPSCFLCAGDARPLSDPEGIRLVARAPRLPRDEAVGDEPTRAVARTTDGLQAAQAQAEAVALAEEPAPADGPTAEDVAAALARVRSKARKTPAYNWPMFRGNVARTGYTPEIVVPPLVHRWQYQVGEWVFATPAVSNGVLYVGSRIEEGSNYGRLCAIEARRGHLLWDTRTGYEVNGSACVVEGTTVFIGLMRSLLALDAATGHRQWEFRCRDIVESCPVCWQNTVYFGSADGCLYAVERHTGKLRWQAQTEMGIHASPAAWADMVYVGSYDHRVYAFKAATGERAWEFMTGGEVTATPAYVNGTIYIGSSDQSLYAIDAATGAKRWEFRTAGEILGSAAMWDNVVYFGSRDRMVYALDAQTGEKIWETETGDWVYSSPALSGGVIYIGGHDRKLRAIEIETGITVWEYETGGEIRSSPVVSEGMVFVGSNDGSVYGFAPGQ
jgi:outer membrane protein assembly factor BamB/tRNA A-37 threonylcarbamoyl transferase component Bud32